MKEKIIKYLFDNADSSIILRVKKEILDNLSNKEEDELINKILRQKNVQAVIKSQKSDGWFGNAFHGQSSKMGAGMYDNMEVGLRYLAEKGFPPENEYILKAINSFLTRDHFDITYGRKPLVPPATDYTYTACGLYLARSSVIIRAGYEYCLPENSFIDLNHDINFSLKTFGNVLNYTDFKEVLDFQKKKLCFKPDILWPCIYHLRMLAHSQAWRNKENINMLADSINRIFSFTHTDEMVYTYVKGQYVGPCFAFINAQLKILEIFGTENLSLDSMELFARCGIITQVPKLQTKYNYLLSLVDDNLNVSIAVNKKNDSGWSPYFGISLEEDWKKTQKINCDLLFRILLILHYTECSK